MHVRHLAHAVRALLRNRFTIVLWPTKHPIKCLLYKFPKHSLVIIIRTEKNVNSIKISETCYTMEKQASGERYAQESKSAQRILHCLRSDENAGYPQFHTLRPGQSREDRKGS